MAATTEPAKQRKQRTTESVYIVQTMELVDLDGTPREAWFDIATVTVPARTKRKSIITAGLKKAGLEPEAPIKVRKLDVDSAHVSEVQAEREPRLRIS